MACTRQAPKRILYGQHAAPAYLIAFVTDTLTSHVINGSTKIYSPSVAATTTLTLPGTTTLTKTSGNGNSATFSHSAAITDTLSAPVLTAASTVKSIKPLVIGTGTVADSTSCVYMWSPNGSKYKLSVTNSGILYFVTVTP